MLTLLIQLPGNFGHGRQDVEDIARGGDCSTRRIGHRDQDIILRAWKPGC